MPHVCIFVTKTLFLFFNVKNGKEKKEKEKKKKKKKERERKKRRRDTTKKVHGESVQLKHVSISNYHQDTFFFFKGIT